MIKYVHIVQVHPVENGEINLHKVEMKLEFGEKKDADWYVEVTNASIKEHGNYPFKAVYLGRVNDATGELE